MKQAIDTRTASGVVPDLIEVVNANRQWLSEIDGAIGDGDHGINMSKGFTLCGQRLAAMRPPPGLPTGFDTLANTLLEDIGGSMGPLYGSFFQAWADALAGEPMLDAPRFATAFDAAVAAVAEIGDAKVGDKTLMDTLVPARDEFRAAVDRGAGFHDALDALVEGARAGQESTRALQARIGRAARLGERSIGVLDAGATSCLLILECYARSLQRLLTGDPTPMTTTLAIGCDEAACALKDTLKAHLEARGIAVQDFGTHDDRPVLYPDVAFEVARSVAGGEFDRAILLCGTGIGMAISANKVPGIRAAQCHDTYSAERASRSNDAQIITLGARVVGPELAKAIVDRWIDSNFDGGRSTPKVERILAYEAALGHAMPAVKS